MRSLVARLAIVLMIGIVNTTHSPSRAQALRIDLAGAAPAQDLPTIALGTPSRSGGVDAITVDRISPRRDGRPWLATMGEFHFSRYPQEEWRDELLKIKAGGIEILATYVFWIHHEEVRGDFDFSGRRDLRRFIELCREVDLPVILRIGPWGHGEVRNGGLPEWLLDQPLLQLRSDDPAYLEHVRPFFRQVARQAQGLLWKDGGPVLGVQLENEYWGPPAHLVTLKRMAIDAGLDVPLYTRTGWPELPEPMPLDEMLPLHGGYAEGFWDRELTPMPGNYWRDFRFSHQREASSVATDHFGAVEMNDDEEARHYPFLTCELGGGMITSYHRRVLVDPRDILAIPVVKLGSGSNLPGYYMYHGGVNPESKTGLTLNERQATRNTNYNDLPVKTYDFQAPIGEAGQVRPHYHLLRRLHTFLRDFGSTLATMPSVLPELRPGSKDDTQTLRWAARSDGRSGFLFINNHQRGLEMPAKPGVRFDLALAGGGSMQMPENPVTIPADSVCVWPFNLALEVDLTLAWATAQPLCRVEDRGVMHTFFAQAPGIPAEFAFDADGVEVLSPSSRKSGTRMIVHVDPADPVLRVRTRSGTEHVIILLGEDRSLSLYRMNVGGRDRVILTSGTVLADQGTLRLQGSPTLSIFPPPDAVHIDGHEVKGEPEGVFSRYSAATSSSPAPVAEFQKIREPGPLRRIPIGKAGVAEQPTDADFDQAAVYRIAVAGPEDRSRRCLLRVSYVGDVARFYLGDTLLTDSFYNGSTFDLALWRYPGREWLLKILPLQKGAPIYLREWPPFESPAFEAVLGVEMIEQQTYEITIR